MDKINATSSFQEFELACIFLLFFSIHYHCQLVKGQLYQNSGGGILQSPSLPPNLWAVGGMGSYE